MAGKLYERQGRSFSLQPVNAEIKKPTLQPLTDVVVKNAAQIAADNYAMGNAIALHDSLKYAYEQAPASPQQFNELADKTIQSFMDANKVPSYARQDLMAKFLTAKQTYASKVETNYYNKQDQEQEQNAYKLSQIQTDEQLSQADSLFKAIVSGDDKNAKIALAGYKNAQNNLKTLSEIKNRKGDYVFNASERKTAQNTQTGLVEAAKRNIDTLSKDELKNFDTTVFQDKLLFQQKTGMDDKSYDEIDKYIKGRRQALGDDEKRVITNQASFTAARLLSVRDPEEFENLKKSGLVDKATISSMEKVYKTAPSQAKVENAFLLEKAMTMLNEEVNTFRPGFDDATNIQKAIVAFGGAFERFAQDNGLDQQQQQEVLDMATKYISDSMFRDSAKGLFADTAISARLKENTSGMFEKNKALKAITPYPVRKLAESAVEVSQPYGDKERAERSARELAHEYTRAWALSAMNDDYDTANKVWQEGNRAVIITANSDKIPEEEFRRMEKDLANGRPAYYTLKDGRTVEFCGYSNKDCIFKTKL